MRQVLFRSCKVNEKRVCSKSADSVETALSASSEKDRIACVAVRCGVDIRSLGLYIACLGHLTEFVSGASRSISGHWPYVQQSTFG